MTVTESFRILNGFYFYCGSMTESISRILENEACVEAFRECGIEQSELEGLMRQIHNLGATTYKEPSPTDFLLSRVLTPSPETEEPQGRTPNTEFMRPTQ